MKYTYTACLHFVSAKHILYLSPCNNSRNKTFQQRGKKLKLHFDHLTEKLKVWGRGREGKSSSLSPYLPNVTAWTTTTSYCQPAECWLHKAKLPCTSFLFHLVAQFFTWASKQGIQRHTKMKLLLSEGKCESQRESKTLLTHCSLTPFTTCTGKSHTKQLPGGEFFSGAQQGWAWREMSNGLYHQGERTELELLPKVVLNITCPLGSVWSW